MNIDVKIEELYRTESITSLSVTQSCGGVWSQAGKAVLSWSRGGHWAEETRTKNHAHVTHLTQKTLNITTFISLFNGVAKPCHLWRPCVGCCH